MSLIWVISDSEFVIVRFLDNYILYANYGDGHKHYGESRHVQPLLDLITEVVKGPPFTLEIRNVQDFSPFYVPTV